MANSPENQTNKTRKIASPLLAIKNHLPHPRSKRVSKKAGLPPGTLVHVGEQKLDTVRLTLIDYNPDTLHESQPAEPDACAPCYDSVSTSWINIDGLHDVQIVENFGRLFHLHPLILEDIVNTTQRPKSEEYDNNLFVVLKMIRHDSNSQLNVEQVSLILTPHAVLSFQENIGDVFDPIRERIRSAKGRLRRSGPDYLFYALIDATVDNYFLVLEKLGERIELLQDALAHDANESVLREIHRLKRDIITLRRAVWPLREVANNLQNIESSLITETTHPFLRDVYDHIYQVLETTETYREMAAGLLDIYLSSVSNRMNAVMKVLTIIATIFIPLTFIAGIYGMNFQHMPELAWPWAYPAVWLVMLAVTVVMLLFFRKKHWL